MCTAPKNEKKGWFLISTHFTYTKICDYRDEPDILHSVKIIY